MDYNNTKHIILYALAGGLIFFLLSAMLSATFIVAILQDDDWCIESVERQVSEYDTVDECIVYKNNLELLKHEHNQKMVTRNGYLVFGEFVLAFIVTIMLFYYIPKSRGAGPENMDGNVFFAIALFAFGISIVMPLIYGWILPPPVEWFPQVFNDIRQSQVDHWYNNLR